MDILAITSLRSRYIDALRAGEAYRDAAENDDERRDFYHALAMTYERSAREMKLMLDTVDRIGALEKSAA